MHTITKHPNHKMLVQIFIQAIQIFTNTIQTSTDSVQFFTDASYIFTIKMHFSPIQCKYLPTQHQYLLLKCTFFTCTRQLFNEHNANIYQQNSNIYKHHANIYNTIQIFTYTKQTYIPIKYNFCNHIILVQIRSNTVQIIANSKHIWPNSVCWTTWHKANSSCQEKKDHVFLSKEHETNILCNLLLKSHC